LRHTWASSTDELNDLGGWKSRVIRVRHTRLSGTCQPFGAGHFHVHPAVGLQAGDDLDALRALAIAGLGDGLHFALAARIDAIGRTQR